MAVTWIQEIEQAVKSVLVPKLEALLHSLDDSEASVTISVNLESPSVKEVYWYLWQRGKRVRLYLQFPTLENTPFFWKNHTGIDVEISDDNPKPRLKNNLLFKIEHFWEEIRTNECFKRLLSKRDEIGSAHVKKVLRTLLCDTRKIKNVLDRWHDGPWE